MDENNDLNWPFYSLVGVVFSSVIMFLFYLRFGEFDWYFLYGIFGFFFLGMGLARAYELGMKNNNTGGNWKTCPECAEKVQAAARKCRYCNYRFETGSNQAAPRAQPAKDLHGMPEYPRTCDACGKFLPKGRTVCAHCGHRQDAAS